MSTNLLSKYLLFDAAEFWNVNLDICMHLDEQNVKAISIEGVQQLADKNPNVWLWHR